MKMIVVASQNPVKLQAALTGFERMFPGENFRIRGLEVPSGVSRQPLTDEETLQGALNRASRACQADPAADFWVGIEGGVEARGDELAAFAWVVVQSTTQVGKGRTGTFFLPPPVANLVRQGVELGEADDIVFQRNNSKQENGAIGLLTGDVIDRVKLYEPAVILALVPFRNPSLYA
jgi:inosine/xanthosine triphosphatase